MGPKLVSELSFWHKFERLLFGLVWGTTVRLLPRSLGTRYKRFVLRLFGASVSESSLVYSSAKIYYPRNLMMEGYSVIGPNVNVYNVDKIIIKDGAIISQGSHLCTASHDITDPNHHLITSPIIIKERAWVAADSFVGMGVTIGEGAVVGARAAVFKDVASWTVVGGNPAKELKKRVMKVL